MDHKVYPATKVLPALLGGLSLFFALGALVVLLAPETARDRSGTWFLLAGSILFFAASLRSLRAGILSGHDGLRCKTLTGEVHLPWERIIEVRLRRGKAGPYWILVGRSPEGRHVEINLGRVKQKAQLVREVKARNPALRLDPRIAESLNTGTS